MESNEILAVVDSVSTEKGIEKDLIFKAIEVAIASASQRHFHEDADLYVEINRETGEYQTHRNWIVFDETNDEFHHETHVTKEDSGLDIGDTFSGVDFLKGLKAVDKLKEILPNNYSMSQLALKWILMHKEISVVIPGAKNSQQATNNVKASELNDINNLMTNINLVYEELIKEDESHGNP